MRRTDVPAAGALAGRVFDYLRGLLSPKERKNSWQLAEQADDTTPSNCDTNPLTLSSRGSARDLGRGVQSPLPLTGHRCAEA